MANFYREMVEPVILHGSSAESATLLASLRRLPKTDFHCHLNGSISPALLAHMERLLLQEHRRTTHPAAVAEDGEVGSPTTQEVEEGHMLFFNTQEKRRQNVLASPTATDAAAALPGASASHSTPKDRMNYCFTVFDAIYKIMTNLAFTRLAVQDMLLCSAAENIAVMEIRTSLRDGLLRTFRHTPDTTTKSGEVVSKAEYVDTVLQTVEHLLSGGLVDFESGELLPMSVSAAIIADPSCRAEKSASRAAQGDAVTRWWCVYDRVYGALFQEEAAAEVALEDVGPNAEPNAASVLRSRLFFVRVVCANWVRRMHVRLLLSINRGAAEAAAWEAAQLTTSTQQRQIEHFHAWCCAAHKASNKDLRDGVHAGSSSGGDGGGRDPPEVMAMLRRTCWVTGIDLSGNCYRGDYTTFSPALEAARNGSLDAEASGAGTTRTTATAAEEGKTAGKRRIRTTAGVTIHGGEKLDEAELRAMVASAPERWGHLVFTDDGNLRQILAAHQGIELCLTSNLLTSGHADVAEHNLGHLLELWNSMPESRQRTVGDGCAAAAGGASGGSCLTCTQAQRDAARATFVRRHYDTAANHQTKGLEGDATLPCQGGSEIQSVYILPNISFHTDDRGVFGTTLSQELVLASQHPGVRRMCAELTGESTMTVTAAAEFFFWLERLSVPQLFNLPLPVQLLAVLTTSDADGGVRCAESHQPSQRKEAYARVRASLSNYAAAPGKETWRDWDAFVQLCDDVCGGNPAYNDVACWLSTWECSWLYEMFDNYCLSEHLSTDH